MYRQTDRQTDRQRETAALYSRCKYVPTNACAQHLGSTQALSDYIIPEEEEVLTNSTKFLHKVTDSCNIFKHKNTCLAEDLHELLIKYVTCATDP